MVIQPAVPRYREPLFSTMASRLDGGLLVLADRTHSMLLAGTWSANRPQYALGEAPVHALGPVRVQWGAPRALARGRVRAVILSWNIRHIDLYLDLAIARARGIPVTLWGHGLTKGPPGLQEHIRRFVGKQAGAVAVYGYRARDVLVENGFPEHRIVVAPNGLDFSVISETLRQAREDAEGVAFRRVQYGFGDRDVLLHVGRLTEPRRIDLAIRAYALSGVCKTSVLAIVGGGPDLAPLRALTELLGLSNDVRFLGPLYDDVELAYLAMMSLASIFPSHSGLGLIHLGGLGLASVCGDDWRYHGPEFEALLPGVTGWTFRHGDIEAFTTVLREVCSSPGEARRRGAAAREWVLSEFNIDRTAAGLLAAVALSEG